MPRAADLSLNDREFILQALRQGLRVDNRAFDEYRPLELTLGDEYGIADVQLGKTRFEDPNSHKLLSYANLIKSNRSNIM